MTEAKAIEIVRKHGGHIKDGDNAMLIADEWFTGEFKEAIDFLCDQCGYWFYPGSISK